jgi:hypothetical protein
VYLLFFHNTVSGGYPELGDLSAIVFVQQQPRTIPTIEAQQLILTALCIAYVTHLHPHMERRLRELSVGHGFHAFRLSVIALLAVRWSVIAYLLLVKDR